MSNTESETLYVGGREAQDLFGRLGGNFADSLAKLGYSYEEACRLVRVLGFAAHKAVQDTGYPNGAEPFRSEEGKPRAINRIPNVTIAIEHSFGEWGGNQLLVMGEGWEALSSIAPAVVGQQGELIVSADHNIGYDGTAIPGGFYSLNFDSTDGLVCDSNGTTYGTYAEMCDTIGAF